MQVVALKSTGAKRLLAKPPRSAVLQSRSRAPLRVRNYCTWQLVPDSRWCADHREDCAVLEEINLTDQIGKKAFCTVGTEVDHSFDSDEVINCQDRGMHVVFEARGESNPLDSPSALFVTDIGSDIPVYVNGSQLPKKQAVQVKPGSVMKFGDHAVYEVLRNVHAHA